jgi:hypothetical protein
MSQPHHHLDNVKPKNYTKKTCCPILPERIMNRGKHSTRKTFDLQIE